MFSHKTSGKKSLKEELIVGGYIHTIKPLLSSTVIIPISIYTLCYDFYYDVQRKIFIYKNKTINKKRNYDVDSYKHSFGAFNMDYNYTEHKNNITVSPIHCHKSIKLNKNFICDGFCYAENASNLLSNDILNENNLDVIFGITKKDKSYPFLLFFNGYSFNKTITHKLTSKMQMKVPKGWNKCISPLFCGNNNGIIYELNGYLYQLKLQNIQKNNCNKYSFIKMEIENENFWKFTNSKRQYIYSYLNMCYIPTENKLFTVENHLNTDGRKGKTKNSWRNYRKRSAIFDFNNNKWIGNKPIEYRSMYSQSNKNSFETVLYYNSNNHSVYMITIPSKTNILISKYDLKKHKWIHIKCKNNDTMTHEFWDRKSTFKPILWLDNQTNMIHLYRAPNFHQYIDLNQENKRWEMSTDNISINDQYSFYKAF